MPLVHVYVGDNDSDPEFVGNFDFLPRTGEYISRQRDDYFKYFHVVEVWYRSKGETDDYEACISVHLRD
ncbi:hypothetical protein OKA06_08610 [Novosphingobium sp. MW5]|nr:hypothetical protein [Novosphingobium sp. MW5]